MASRNGKFGVGILIDAQNRVSGPAERAARSMMVLGQDVAASGRIIETAMGAAAGGIAVFTTGVKALKGLLNIASQAGTFEQEMAAVKTIIGATGGEFKRLEDAALKASEITQFSPLEAAKTMRALGQTGMTATDAIAALKPALDLSAASLGKLQPERAAQTLNATLKAFGLGADQSQKAMDSLVFATNRFNISIEQLPIGIGNISRGAIALGQDMDSTLNVLGLTKNILPNISKAATLTSSAMLRIADASVQKKMTQMGVSFQDAQGKFLPLIEIFQSLNNVLKAKYTKEVDRAAIVTKLLGKQAIAPFAAVTSQLDKGIPVAARLTEGMKGVTIDKRSKQAILKGAQAIQFLGLQAKASRGEIENIPKEFIGLRKEAAAVRKEAGKGQGAGALFVKTLLDTFTGQVTLLKGVVQGFVVAIGKPLAAAFRPWVEIMFVTLGNINAFIRDMDKDFKNFLARLAIGGSIALVVAGAAMAIKTAFLFLAPVLGAVLVPFLKIFLIVAALIVLAEGLRFAWSTNLGGIRTMALSLWAGIKQGFDEFIGPLMKEFIPFLGQMFTEMFKSINAALVSFGLASKDTTGKFSVGWMEVGRIIFHVFGFFIKAMIMAVAGIAQLISWLANLIGWFGKAFSVVGSFFSSIFGGKGQALPVATIRAEAGGRVLTLNQNQTPAITPIVPTPVPIGTKTVTPPTQTIFSGPNPFQQPQPQAAANVPIHGTVLLDRQQVGTILFDQQKENQSRGLIRTTVKEQ